MSSNKAVRVLFLHATWHHTSEYNVHRLLAEKADPNLIACSEFVRQTALDEGVAPEQIETLLHGANVEEYAIERNPK
jgi:hypothetical protein